MSRHRCHHHSIDTISLPLPFGPDQVCPSGNVVERDSSNGSPRLDSLDGSRRVEHSMATSPGQPGNLLLSLLSGDGDHGGLKNSSNSCMVDGLGPEQLALLSPRPTFRPPFCLHCNRISYLLSFWSFLRITAKTDYYQREIRPLAS